MDELRQVEEELFHLFSNLPVSKHYPGNKKQWLNDIYKPLDEAHYAPRHAKLAFAKVLREEYLARLDRLYSRLAQERQAAEAHAAYLEEHGTLVEEYVSQYHRWLTGEGPLPNIHNVVIK